MPKFRKFRLDIKWNGSFWFGPTGIFGTTFESGPLWPVLSFRSVGPKCPFPFDKIVVPSTALLHPAYKNINQTLGGLGPVCATGMYHSVDSLGMWNIQTFETNWHFCWMEPWVSAGFEYSYKSLKSKFSLILFVYNLMIGCSKENGANYPKKYGREKGKMLASEASSSVGLGRGKERRSLRHPLTSSDYRSARFDRSPTFFPAHANFFSFFPWPRLHYQELMSRV